MEVINACRAWVAERDGQLERVAGDGYDNDELRADLNEGTADDLNDVLDAVAQRWPAQMPTGIERVCRGVQQHARRLHALGVEAERDGLWSGYDSERMDFNENADSDLRHELNEIAKHVGITPLYGPDGFTPLNADPPF